MEEDCGVIKRLLFVTVWVIYLKDPDKNLILSRKYIIFM